MGGGSKPKPPPPPKAPPPPAEEISAEVIAPTMRQEAARRASTGAYLTKGQKLGAQGQLLGASPIQLANVRAATYSKPKLKSFEEYDPERLKEARKYKDINENVYDLKMYAASRAYDKYVKDYNKRIKGDEKIKTSSGMTI